MSQDKIIILDRDGVINHDSHDYIKSVKEWVPIAGSLEAIAKLNAAGYKVMLATNQAGIAKGIFLKERMMEIHQKLKNELKELGGEIADIFYCPHHPDDNCECRKPKPGMLINIAKKYNVNLQNVCMIGDSIKDILAAKAAGAVPHFVLTGIHDVKGNPALQDVHIHKDLASCVDWILSNN